MFGAKYSEPKKSVGGVRTAALFFCSETPNPCLSIENLDNSLLICHAISRPLSKNYTKTAALLRGG